MAHLVRPLLLAAFALAALASLPARAEPLHLTIVHVNDLDRMGEDGGRGGMARLAAVVNRARAAGGPVLVTHGGDAISPSLLSGFDQGAHIVDLLNQVGIDVMAAGNHEFDFGPAVLAERAGDAHFPILSANAQGPGGGLPEGLAAHVTFEYGDWTIGVFGLTTPETAVRSSPGAVTFADVFATAATEAAALEADGADFTIALAHTTAAEDDALIAQGAVPLILGGDDHYLRIEWSGGSAFAESGAQAAFVTVIDLVLDRDADGAVAWHASFAAINTADVAPDAAVAAAVAAYETQLDAELGVEIPGTTATPLDTRRAAVRTGEAAFGNLVADAMRAAVGADIAITNGGGIRADRDYPAGSVLTRRDIQEELPFGNRTVLLELTGADVLAALETGFSGIEEGAGRFPQVSGLAVGYDPTRPAGARVVSVTVGGAPLDPAATYRVATNDFLARGGDGYAALTHGRTLIDPTSGGLMATQVIDHIATAGTVAPTVEGRLTDMSR